MNGNGNTLEQTQMIHISRVTTAMQSGVLAGYKYGVYHIVYWTLNSVRWETIGIVYHGVAT